MIDCRVSFVCILRLSVSFCLFFYAFRMFLFKVWCYYYYYYHHYYCYYYYMLTDINPLTDAPQWGAADAEIKVPSGENTELKHSPFIAWSRSVYSHTCYAYCQGFLPCLFLPFQSIHLHFFQNLSRFFPVLALANTGSCVGPQNKIGQPAWCGFPCWVPAEYK